MEIIFTEFIFAYSLAGYHNKVATSIFYFARTVIHATAQTDRLCYIKSELPHPLFYSCRLEAVFAKNFFRPWIKLKVFCANFQILGPLGCQGWVVIFTICEKVKITPPYCPATTSPCRSGWPARTGPPRRGPAASVGLGRLDPGPCKRTYAHGREGQSALRRGTAHSQQRTTDPASASGSAFRTVRYAAAF